MPPESSGLAPVIDQAGLQAAFSIRFRVFVEEQGVPPGEEIDSHDPRAYHVLGRDQEGIPVATGRLVPLGTTGRIGRMAVLKSSRGQGWGTRVMKALMEEASRRRLELLILDSQIHAMPFYQRLGFLPEGPVFLDCEIPHRRMQRPLTSPNHDQEASL